LSSVQSCSNFMSDTHYKLKLLSLQKLT
jgi:hypothetical protein